MRAVPYLCFALIAAASSVSAQTMKPGLWEMKQQPQLDAKRQAQMDQAQKQLATLPAEQRAMLEQMMAKNGLKVDIAGGSITLKACVSKEQAENNKPPISDKGSCTSSSTRSGNVIHARFSCSNPASEGESDVTLTGSDSFSTQTRVTTQRDGRSETINVSGSGRWLGSDCGGLQPQVSK